MRPTLSIFVLSLTLAGVTGCASTGDADDRRTVTILVEHELSLSGPLTIAIHDENGPRRLLGTVSPEGPRRFDFRPANGGQYVLVSESQWTRTIRSPAFFIAGGTEGVVWDLAANQISTY